ncbi:MAG: T9SS type A sorting domain-containing protein [Saprospiraceae bacterium]|nr:T9SS type A sorting domain-containing protein [Saprospiraceae bacterium]
MKRFLFFALLLCMLRSHAQSPTSPPFLMELQEVTFPEWPALHSFAFAQWDGYWIMVAGRSNGLHGFFPFTGFPESSANKYIWVLNPENGEKWSYDVTQLPTHLADALLVTNPQFLQIGQKLYVLGGYGKESTSGDFITFSKMTALNLPALVSAVQSGGNVQGALRQTSDDRIKICGGEMHHLGDDLYLIGGHNFEGLYSQTGAPVFTQTYTSKILRFRIQDDANQLSITNYSAFQDPEYHRRDLNLAPLMLPGMVPALGVYGGVFRPEADVPYFNPIYITGQNIDLDESYAQKMSQYTCPIVPIYDEVAENMYSIFFAGLSYHTYNENNHTFEVDELVPFIDQITTFVRYANGSSEEVVMPQVFDELLGTNAKFILNDDVAHYDNEVIDLRALQGRTDVGCIFGGIKAAIPNITPSSATNRLFKVLITPLFPNSVVETGAEEIKIAVTPNPFHYETRIQLSHLAHFTEAIITDLSGRMASALQADDTRTLLQKTEAALKALHPGMYTLLLNGDNQKAVTKVVKIH